MTSSKRSNRLRCCRRQARGSDSPCILCGLPVRRLIGPVVHVIVIGRRIPLGGFYLVVYTAAHSAPGFVTKTSYGVSSGPISFLHVYNTGAPPCLIWLTLPHLFHVTSLWGD